MGSGTDLVDDVLGPAPMPADLIGLQFNGLAFAADTAMFSFGALSPHTFRYGPRKGETVERGSHALHVQCAWRLQRSDGVIASDRNAASPDLAAAVIGSVVTEVRMDAVMGDLVVAFASGHLLIVFPNNADAEDWRLLIPGSGAEHFVWRDREE